MTPVECRLAGRRGRGTIAAAPTAPAGGALPGAGDRKAVS